MHIYLLPASAVVSFAGFYSKNIILKEAEISSKSEMPFHKVDF